MQRLVDDTLELVWLIPQRYWEASAAQQPSLSDEDRKHFLSQLDGYLLFATVRGKVGIAGIDQFASAEAVRDGLREAQQLRGGGVEVDGVAVAGDGAVAAADITRNIPERAGGRLVGGGLGGGLDPAGEFKRCKACHRISPLA